MLVLVMVLLNVAVADTLPNNTPHMPLQQPIQQPLTAEAEKCTGGRRIQHSDRNASTHTLTHAHTHTHHPTQGIGPSVIVIYNPFGVPAHEVMLPQLLKTAGYSTHAVGKWHLGACDNRYEPTYRGFDSFMGYLAGTYKPLSHRHLC